MTAVERHKARIDSRRVESTDLDVGTDPRRELVPRTHCEDHGPTGEATGELRHIDIGRKGPRPENDLIRPHATAARDPTAHRRDALRESEYAQPNAGGRTRRQEVIEQRVEVRDLIDDLMLAILSRHPRRTDAGLRVHAHA